MLGKLDSRLLTKGPQNRRLSTSETIDWCKIASDREEKERQLNNFLLLHELSNEFIFPTVTS